MKLSKLSQFCRSGLLFMETVDSSVLGLTVCGNSIMCAVCGPHSDCFVPLSVPA